MWEPYGPDMAYVSLCKDININFAFASCIIEHFSFHNISCTKTNPGTKILNTKISKRIPTVNRQSAVFAVLKLIHHNVHSAINCSIDRVLLEVRTLSSYMGLSQ